MLTLGVCGITPEDSVDSLIIQTLMPDEVLIKRYNTYYHSWCLSFGEHEAIYDEARDICWLFGEERIGMALAPNLRRRLYLALLGREHKEAELALRDEAVEVGDRCYPLTDEVDLESMAKLKSFLRSEDELHLYLTNHFCYPSGTRIITFSRKKPPAILYKEMRPLKVNLR